MPHDDSSQLLLASRRRAAAPLVPQALASVPAAKASAQPPKDFVYQTKFELRASDRLRAMTPLEQAYLDAFRDEFNRVTDERVLSALANR